jgi:hypothetical protein
VEATGSYPSAKCDSTLIDVREPVWESFATCQWRIVWRESGWGMQRNVEPHSPGQDLRKRVGARMCMKDNDQGIT